MPVDQNWLNVHGPRYIGGDVELHANGSLYRGPTTDLEIHGNTLYVHAQWCAVFMTDKDGLPIGWRLIVPGPGATPVRSEFQLPCSDLGEPSFDTPGRVRFGMIILLFEREAGKNLVKPTLTIYDE